MTAESNFLHRLQDDKTWRIVELSELVRACKEGSDARKSAVARSAVPVIYAHWEGYFVLAANSYLVFLTEKRLKIGALRDEFWALCVRKRFRPQQVSGDIQFNRFLLSIKAEEDRIFKKGNFERINGRSNLNSETLEYCCRALGLDFTVFDDYLEFIDKQLIDRRNFIAHGESLRFPIDHVPVYRDSVVDLMRATYDLFENAALSGSYLRPVV